MAYRFSEYVVGGHINNTKPHRTFGYFVLAGEENAPVCFDLFGDCGPDMQGKVISFEVAQPPSPPAESVGVRPHLFGSTGDISAAGWVRQFDCSVEEYLRRSKLGEAPPTYWVRRFYFEFYCQQGRVVIELSNPTVEYNAGDEDHEDWRPLPNTKPMPGPPDKKPDPNSIPEMVIFDDEGRVERVDPRDYLDERGESREINSLQHELDKQSRAVDRAISGASDDDDIIAELEATDNAMLDAIDDEKGDPISQALYTAHNLPAPDEIAEEEIEPLLKALVGEMALYGMSFSICDHYSLRDAYRLLYNNMDDEWRFHPKLAVTGWVQSFSTSDHCKKCDEEFDERNREFNAKFEAEQKLKKQIDRDQQP